MYMGPDNDHFAALLGSLRRVHEATAAELGQALVTAAASLTGAPAALLLLTDAGGLARVAAATGFDPQAVDRFAAPLDEELPAQIRAQLGILPEEQVLAAPLMAGQSVRGLLAVRRPAGERADVLLLSLADHAVIALERTERERRLATAEQAAAAAVHEQRLLRALLASAPGGIWLADPDGRVRVASDWALDRSGPGGPQLKPGEALPGDREPPLVRALRLEETEQEEWLLGEGSRQLPVLCSAAPLRARDGTVLGAVLLGQDLRGHVAREAGERRRVAEEEANRAKDIFFNALSHELRTPLAAILFALEVLQHPQATEVQRERAHRTIERNVRHQVRLIDDLLDISRIIRRRAHIERRPVELRDLVAGRTATLQEAAERAGLTLVMQLPPAPITVKGDPSRLEQVVNILVENAIKFTDAGGLVEVRLSTEDGGAVLRVRDTGAGMAADMIPRLFQPMQQADRSLSRSRGGLGAGLAIARWVVEQHGGRTSATSAGLGAGSEFVVKLPVAQPSESVVADEEPAAAIVDGSARRIMVVEDNHDLLDTLLSLLEMLGHQVVPAPNGTTALEAAQREHPEVAFIDIGLPDMDGYELARRLRADRGLQGMRLVALTGYASEHHRERALRAGFDDYLAKPVDMETIKLALDGGARARGERRV